MRNNARVTYFFLYDLNSERGEGGRFKKNSGNSSTPGCRFSDPILKLSLMLLSAFSPSLNRANNLAFVQFSLALHGDPGYGTSTVPPSDVDPPLFQAKKTVLTATLFSSDYSLPSLPKVVSVFRPAALVVGT